MLLVISKNLLYLFLLPVTTKYSKFFYATMLVHNKIFFGSYYIAVLSKLEIFSQRPKSDIPFSSKKIF